MSALLDVLAARTLEVTALDAAICFAGLDPFETDTRQFIFVRELRPCTARAMFVLQRFYLQAAENNVRIQNAQPSLCKLHKLAKQMVLVVPFSSFSVSQRISVIASCLKLSASSRHGDVLSRTLHAQKQVFRWGVSVVAFKIKAEQLFIRIIACREILYFYSTTFI